MPSDPVFLSADELEAHVVWLRRLASSLVGDPHAAEDLAQETWVRALAHRPATDRPVGAWLAVVARNLARMGRRSAARRGSHVPLDERDLKGPATVDVVARAEAARRLVEAVTALDEPFRTTVLLRYAEGLSGAEIARRTGVPDGTVRWRLKRGLDTLRERLDADGDRGDRALGALLLPFWRSEASGAGATALAAGGVVMGLKSIAAVVLGVVLVGAAGWLVSRSGRTPPPADEPAVTRGAVEKLKAHAEPLVVLRASAAIAGVVRTFETRAPIAGARVSVGWPTRGADSPLETVTDRDGGYRLPRVPVGEEVELVVRRAGYVDHEQDVRITAGGEERFDIWVPEGVTLRVRVIDAESRRPLAGVRVDADRRLETDEEGRVVLRGLVQETPYAEFRMPGYCMTSFMPDRATLRDAGEIEIEMVPGCVLRGEIRGGAPAEPGAWIVFAKDAGPYEPPGGARVMPGSGATFGKTDAAGRFRLESLVPGRSYEVTARHRERALVLAGEASFERPGEVVELVLDEPRFGSIEGTVRLGPGPGRVVRWSGATSWGHWFLREASTYRFDEVEAGNVELELAYGNRVLSRAVVGVREGATIRHDFVTAAPSARVGGVVRRPSGSPVSAVELHLRPFGSRGSSLSAAVTDADGRFELVVPADTAPDLEIQYDWTLRTFFLEPHRVRLGDEDVDLVLPRAAHPRLRIVDADTGVPLPRVLVGWRMDVDGRPLAPHHPSTWRPGLHGVAPQQLPAGTITLVLDATLLGYDVTEIPDFVVPPDDPDVVRELRLHARR